MILLNVPSHSRNRKRKNSLVEVPAATDSSELAVGTAAGSVIIYCAKTAEYKETRVHEEAVNSLVRIVGAEVSRHQQ